MYAMSSFVHYFEAIIELKLDLAPGSPQFWWKSAIFCPCDLGIW